MGRLISSCALPLDIRRLPEGEAQQVPGDDIFQPVQRGVVLCGDA
jgi:hypothetical protein